MVNRAFHLPVMELWRDIIKSKSRQNWAKGPGKSSRESFRRVPHDGS